MLAVKKNETTYVYVFTRFYIYSIDIFLSLKLLLAKPTWALMGFWRLCSLLEMVTFLFQEKIWNNFCGENHHKTRDVGKPTGGSTHHSKYLSPLVTWGHKRNNSILSHYMYIYIYLYVGTCNLFVLYFGVWTLLWVPGIYLQVHVYIYI